MAFIFCIESFFLFFFFFYKYLAVFNINVTARVWNCTLLLIQELSLVDAVVLKAAIVLGDSPWLGLNHRACCYPSQQWKDNELWNICYRQIAEWDLQSWGRVAWKDVAKIKWRGENKEKVEKKKAPVTKRECELKFACTNTDALSLIWIWSNTQIIHSLWW